MEAVAAAAGPQQVFDIFIRNYDTREPIITLTVNG